MTAYRMVDRKQLRFHLRASRRRRRRCRHRVRGHFICRVLHPDRRVLFLRAVRAPCRQFCATELRWTKRNTVVRERTADNPRCDRLLIFDLEGEMFLRTGADLEKHLAAIEKRLGPPTQVVVRRLNGRQPDAVCLALFDDFIAVARAPRHCAPGRRASGRGPRLAEWRHCRPPGPGALFLEAPGPESSTLDAVRYAYGLLKEDYCATCPRREEQEGSKEALYMI